MHPPKAEKRDGNMYESGASFHSVHHNPVEDLHRKKAADRNDDIPQYSLLCSLHKILKFLLSGAVA
jgi:hypothetical protein